MKKYIVLVFAFIICVLPTKAQQLPEEIIGMLQNNVNYYLSPYPSSMEELWPGLEKDEQLLQRLGGERYNLDDKLSSIYDKSGKPLMDILVIIDRATYQENGTEVEHPRSMIFLKFENMYLQLNELEGMSLIAQADRYNLPLDIATFNFYVDQMGLGYSNPLKVYVTGSIDNAASASDMNDPNTFNSSHGFIYITADKNMYKNLGVDDEPNPAYTIDLYLDDVKIACADKVVSLNSLTDVLLGFNSISADSSPIAFASNLEDDGAILNIHIKGKENKLVGGNVNFSAMDILESVSSPISLHSLSADIDGISATRARLNFDDLWPLDANGNTYHTNGLLDLTVKEALDENGNPNGNHATPAIDLGFPNGQCYFNGGQYIFSTAANNNIFFVSSMSVCYKLMSFFGMTCYGMGSSVTTSSDKGAVEWNMYLNSGTFTTHSAEEYADRIDVVARGWYNDYTDLRIPLRSVIGDDATFNNCNVYFCDAAGEVGVEPTRTITNENGRKDTISLCRRKIEVEVADIDEETGLKKNSNMTPVPENDGKYYVYQYVDASKCDNQPKENRKYVRNWVTVIPKMGLVMTGEDDEGNTFDQDVLTMGGDVYVSERTEDEMYTQTNSFMFYAQLHEKTKDYARVDLKLFDPSVNEAIENARGSGEPHEFSDVTNTDSYTIEHGIYSMLSFEPNRWHTICAPYDIHNVYVMETNGVYKGTKNDAGYEGFLNDQGLADGKLAQTIVTSLCPDILSKKGSGVNLSLLEIAEKQLGMKLNEDNDGKGIYTLKHYNPDLGDDHSAKESNYFLYELSETCPIYGGGLYWNVSNNGDVSNYWTPVIPIAPQTTYTDRLGNEVEKNLLGEKVTILMQKGHVYSFYLPETDNAPYWEGKYLVFEGYGPQTLDGKSVQKQFTTITDLTEQEQLYDELGIGRCSEEELREWIETATNPILKKQYQDMLDMKISGLTIANYLAFVGNSTFGNDTIGIHAPYNDVESDLLWSPLGTNENGTFTFVKEDRTFYRPFDTWVVASQATMDIVKENMGQQPASLPKLGPLSPENEEDIADLEHLPHIGDVILKAWQQNGISIATFATTNVEVYSLTGIKIWSGTMQDGGYKHLTVPMGLYIIRTDNQSVKVMVE